MGGVISKTRNRTLQRRNVNHNRHAKPNDSMKLSSDWMDVMERQITQGVAASSGDDFIISESEKREFATLFMDKKISMDFIVEMKEAFSFFDTVCNQTRIYGCIYIYINIYIYISIKTLFVTFCRMATGLLVLRN